MQQKKQNEKYTVIRDTREQKGWDFFEDDYCDGMIEKKLDSGDYSILGLENVFCIEKKRNTAELAKNIFEKRFFAELQRLEKFDYSFLILEFNLIDVLNFPFGSGIPQNKW